MQALGNEGNMFRTGPEIWEYGLGNKDINNYDIQLRISCAYFQVLGMEGNTKQEEPNFARNTSHVPGVPKKTPLKDMCDYLAKRRFLGHPVYVMASLEWGKVRGRLK